MKWLNPLYGKMLMRTIPLMFCPRFPGFFQPHLPSALKKSTFEEVWSAEPEMLDMTCSHKFRSQYDVNQWVLREWQLAKNSFYPRSLGVGRCFFPDRDGKGEFERAAEYISGRRKKLVCINDCKLTEEEVRQYSRIIAEAFEKSLPEKSEFEK